MTLKRSTVQSAEFTAAGRPYLRVCPPPSDAPEPPGTSDHSKPTEPPSQRQNVFTRDELALISLFADGLCIETIARRLDLSDRTIRRRSRALCDRLGVVSTIQVVAWAARRQLI